MNSKNPSAFEFFSALYKETNQVHREYFIEILSVFLELNYIFKSAQNHFERLNNLLFFFDNAKPTFLMESDGTEKEISADENAKKIYDGFLREEIPASVIYINLYIKSLKTLENKLSLLINKKGDLGFKEGRRFYSRFVSKDWKAFLKKSKLIKILGCDFYPKLVWDKIDDNKSNPKMSREIVIKDCYDGMVNCKKLLKERRDIEHNTNKINENIITFLMNNHKNSSFLNEVTRFKAFFESINTAHSEIIFFINNSLKEYLLNTDVSEKHLV